MREILESVKHRNSNLRASGRFARRLGLVKAPKRPANLAIVPPHGLAIGNPVERRLLEVEVPAAAIGFTHDRLKGERPLLLGPLLFRAAAADSTPISSFEARYSFVRIKLPDTNLRLSEHIASHLSLIHI